MKLMKSSLVAVGASLLLVACGGGGGDPAGVQVSNPASGQLMQNPPPRTIGVTTTELAALLTADSAEAQGLLSLATSGGTVPLKCGVDVHYIKYGTVGGKGEATQSSGALMVPTGGTGCNGQRPIVLFAHGTMIERRYNLADFADSTNPAHGEQGILATLFASKGFIVVAPNYAGYDSSPLPYHPFMVLNQQSQEMIDALKAARTALPNLIASVSDSGKLFITGVSQGGAVAMATHRAMEAQGMTVTGSAPIEPVSALSLYGDYAMAGHAPAGSTVFLPMLFNGYQKTYGDVYNTTAVPVQAYQSEYLPSVENSFPGAYSYDSIFSNGIVPLTAVFSTNLGAAPTDGTPAQNLLFSKGFASSHYLLTDAFRGAYLQDAGAHSSLAAPPTTTFALRAHAAANDMRSWTTGPQTAPMLLCAGHNDPTVFYGTNTSVTAQTFASHTLPPVFELDLESSNTSVVGRQFSTASPAAAGLVTAVRGAFGQAVTATYTADYTAAGGAANQAAADLAGQTAVATKYHGHLVPPFCAAAASGFFSSL